MLKLVRPRLSVLLTTLALAALAAGDTGDQAEEKSTPPAEQGPRTAATQPAPPIELTDPLEILRRVDAAARAVKTVQYDVAVEGTGAARPLIGSLKAAVIATGFARGIPQRFRVQAEVLRPGKTQATKVEGGSDGDLHFLIDHAGKRAHVDMSPAVMGSFGRPIISSLTMEFHHPAPFSDEINSARRELRGSRTIGGEDCYEIHIVYASDQAPEATWCFSKRDFLPRRRVDLFTMPGGEKAGLRKTITNLKVTPELAEDAYEVRLPDGYSITDKSAP